MKNLANCKPSEFIRQTNRIRKSVEKWLTVTDLKGIRSRDAVLKDGMTADEIQDAKLKQAQSNISEMLDSIMEKHPDETLEILALMCFVEPQDVDDHPVSEYLGALGELLSDENILGFFMSLMELVHKTGLDQ